MSNGTSQWSGEHDIDAWRLEVEVDRLTSNEPFVAAVWTECDDDGKTIDALAPLSAEQARECAAALLVVADAVDENNARVARHESRADRSQTSAPQAQNRSGEQEPF